LAFLVSLFFAQRQHDGRPALSGSDAVHGDKSLRRFPASGEGSGLRPAGTPAHPAGQPVLSIALDRAAMDLNVELQVPHDVFLFSP